MTEEQLPAAEVAPLNPEQDLPSIIARLEAIGSEVAASLEGLYDNLDKQSEAHKEAFEAALTERLQSFGYQPSDYEGVLCSLDVLQEISTLSTDVELGYFATTLRPRIEEAVVLERAAGQLANNELHEVRSELIANTRWDSVIAKSVSMEEYDDLRDALGLCNHHSGRTPLSLGDAQLLTKRIHDWQERFAIQDDLFSEGEIQQLPEGRQPTADLGRVIEDWLQSNEDVRWYLSPSRQTFLEAALPTAQLANVRNLQHGIYSARDPHGEYVPWEIAYALEKNTETLMQAFDSKDVEYLQISAQEQPNMLFVGNQRLVKEATKIDDVNAWLQQRIARHPASLTQGLGFVNFKEDFKEGVIDENQALWSMTGATEVSENTVSVGVERDYMADVIDKDPSLADTVKRLRQPMIEDTIDHELSHYAHRQRLSIAWLRKWHEITESEHANVTRYVESMRSDNPVDRGHAACEDLAESSSLYLNKPGNLLVTASERFAILNERDGRYDPSLVASLRAFIEKSDFMEGMIEMCDKLLQENAEKLIAGQKVALATSTITVDTI